LGWSQLADLKAIQRENPRLKEAVADRVRDKLILKDSLDFFEAAG
jgi:hypothetical protein